MEILNENEQHKVKFFRLIYFILVVTAIAILYTTRLFDDNFPKIKKDYFLFIFILLYVIINLIRIAMRYSYFYFSDDMPNLTFRFFHLAPFSTKRLEFSIPKTVFHDFKIKNKLLGLRKDLILYRKNKGEIVTYPPISLSAVSKEDITQLRQKLSALKINK